MQKKWNWEQKKNWGKTFNVPKDDSYLVFMQSHMTERKLWLTCRML